MHRTLPFALLLAAACGNYQPGSSPIGGSVAIAAQGNEARSSAARPDSGARMPLPNSSEALVVEAFITARVDDVRSSADAIATRVRDVGGRIVHERGNGAAQDWHTYMQVRLPPAEVDALLTWLGEDGDIEKKRIQVQDVSKQLFDKKLAEENLRATLTRLQALLQRPELDIEAVLKIEAEMTRVRGQIEALEGEQRYLKDRVAFATIDFTLKRKDRLEHGPTTKFLAGIRAANMTLVDPGERLSNRSGFGIVVQSPLARLSYELQVFEADEGEKRPFVATMGGAMYSDHLGGGTRKFLNPYIGARVGYGRLDGSNFVVSGEAGVELLRHKFITLDANVRGTTFFGKGGPDVAVVSAAGLSLSF